MTKQTKLIVYVVAEEMSKPDSLWSVVIEKLIKKDYPQSERKRFMALYYKAVDEKAQLAVINDWVQVRDIKTFPFRKKNEGIENAPVESEIATGNTIKLISVSTEQVKGAKPVGMIIDEAEDADENEEVEGGVPVDDGADGEQESGVASE